VAGEATHEAQAPRPLRGLYMALLYPVQGEPCGNVECPPLFHKRNEPRQRTGVISELEPETAAQHDVLL
jgi:hypothetical protein